MQDPRSRITAKRKDVNATDTDAATAAGRKGKQAKQTKPHSSESPAAACPLESFGIKPRAKLARLASNTTLAEPQSPEGEATTWLAYMG